jgi:hypothetical protein
MVMKANSRGEGMVAQDGTPPLPRASAGDAAVCFQSAGCAIEADEIAAKANSREAAKMRQRCMSLS